jgi:hypothetical protein
VNDGQKKLGDQNRSEGTSASTSSSTHIGTSGSTSRNTSGSSSLNNSTHIVVLHGASTTHSTIASVDPTIILTEFHGDGSEYLETHLFMCE